MIALSNAVEPLRMANIITGENVYQWSIVSLEGQPTPASNGLQLSPTLGLEQLGAVDILFVCGGVNVQEAVSPKVVAALRRARELLLQTSMPIIDITTACGFQSPPHFSRCYRAQFGCPPSAERQSHQAKTAAAVGQTVTSVA